MATTSSTKTAELNVGGSKYEVSRSLIEQYPDTMLARLVSETWQRDEQEIFIDRSGLRFQYVLDYMRDKKVHVGLGILVAAIKTELQYSTLALKASLRTRLMEAVPVYRLPSTCSKPRRTTKQQSRS
ncbi:PotAssium voltage-gated channel [Seminavis robusta]|uniref:PotAssium voltage-gated channel n=1 Tax=Seminavis robusta TaxID=568900 RepID=A0A9N8HMN7_9STRA|nr:PotAssium voltage-gated channel [Seminavis robusta]|eukprot:Sro1015_g231510.1 PotAssium voltage-gated channel (127) ;mRNA; r:15321-15701